MTYIVTLTDAAKTDINVEVDPDCAFARYYGLVQAVLEEARKTETYKALREAEDAQVRSIWIDGEEITQF
ncbi:MAG: hypothetical protein ACOY45_05895 [Pseudomonadota bacterium]